MRKLLLILLTLLPLTLMAEDMTERIWSPHEIRIGYGDPMFETMVWHNSPTYFTLEKTMDYKFTGHIFAEYHYRPNAWFSYGGQIDYQQVFWKKEDLVDGSYEYSNHNFFDISVMPTVRFTFFWSEYVNLYCGMGAGLLINGGTDKDFLGHQVAFAPVADLRILGLSVGKGMFFGTVDLGGMFSLLNTNTIYMIGSRIFTASVGVRF